MRPSVGGCRSRIHTTRRTEITGVTLWAAAAASRSSERPTPARPPSEVRAFRGMNTPTDNTSQHLVIGQHKIQLQCFARTKERDFQAPDLAAQTEPIQLSAWPVSGSELTAAAVAKLANLGVPVGRRGDCLWALKAVGFDLSATHYWLEAETKSQRDRDHAKARSDVLDC